MQKKWTRTRTTFPIPYYAIPAKFAYFDKLSEFKRGFAKKSKGAKIHFTSDTNI